MAELRAAAQAAGIRVREERLLREVGYHARSGLCRLRGEEVLLLDSDLPAELRIDLLSEALEGRPVDEGILSDEARAALARAGLRRRRPPPPEPPAQGPDG